MIAVYVRISTTSQNLASQEREIQRWLDGHGLTAKWFVDQKTGDNLDRPGFEQLQKAVFDGEVDTIVVYKLDRISRSLKDGITTLVDWCEKGIRVVSTSQQIDFSGSVGKMIASVLFSVAEMEQETRRERQAAGIAAAKNRGVKFGGSKKGKRKKLQPSTVSAIKNMKRAGETITNIAKTFSISRTTVYDVVGK